MKRWLAWCGAVCVWAGAALAQSPVTITVDPRVDGPVIPANFVGLSFGMKALLPDRAGQHFFSPTNTALIGIFQNLGLKHLRLGGTTVESPPETPIPGEPEIDELFAFARAAGVDKVIYSFRLLETNAALNYASTNAALAKYIWDRYRSQVDCFAIGNEPDLKRVFKQDESITNFSSYLKKWKRFATAISAAAPGAKFTGPDAGSGSISWTIQFAKAAPKDGSVAVISEHFYVGAAGRGVEPARGIDTMLSPEWDDANLKIFEKVAAPVAALGFPFRFTEANDHYSGGVSNASDTFAGALWALDFLHWWAAHEAQGVDFHNTMWVVNDIITRGAGGQLSFTPKGYGLKAFALGGHGRMAPVQISNSETVNLTAYAVRNSGELFVTVINKEHGPGRAAAVTVTANGLGQNAEAAFLVAPNGDVSTKTGAALSPWTPLLFRQPNQCTVTVAPASAVILKIPIK